MLPIDVFSYGFLSYSIPFGLVWLFTGKYQEYKSRASIAGLGVTILGFLFWWLVFDGIEARAIQEIAESLIVLVYAIIFGLGAALAAFISSKFPAIK